MKLYIEAVESNEVITNRLTGATRKIVAKIEGKQNRRLVNVLVGNTAVPTWIDAPGYKLAVKNEEGVIVGELTASFLNVLEPAKPKVAVVAHS